MCSRVPPMVAVLAVLLYGSTIMVTRYATHPARYLFYAVSGATVVVAMLYIWQATLPK